MGETPSILYEVERGRARITLNRPEKRNALNREVLRALVAAVTEAERDRSVRAIVLDRKSVV